MKAWIVAGLLAAGPLSASAQVGYQPDRSPYRDREYTRNWTLLAGRYNARKDPEGVAPQDGPMAGVRWEMRLTGPLYFAARLAGTVVDRTVIDPSKLIVERVVTTERVPLVLGDVGLELSLTGHKTWHGFAPFVNGGVGFAADVRGSNDVGGFRFGVPFTMTYGSGLTWSPNNAWHLRLDWSSYVPHLVSEFVLPEGHRRRRGARRGGRAPFWRRVSPVGWRVVPLSPLSEADAATMATARLTRRVRFSSAHRYRRPEWDDAENARVFGMCAHPNYHGHAYVCSVTVAGEIDALTGMVFDLGALDAVLEREVVRRFDHRNINLDVPEFADGRLVPTGENLARFILDRVQAAIGDAVMVAEVTVAEDDTLSATVFRGA